MDVLAETPEEIKTGQWGISELSPATLCWARQSLSEPHKQGNFREKQRQKKLQRTKKPPSVSGEQAPHQVNEECLVEALSANAR